MGNPEEVSILELAKLVKRLTGSDSEIRLIPYDQAYQPGFEDMHRRVPNIAKISKLMGFKPSLRLREIVARIIESRQEQVEESVGLPVTVDVQPHSLRAVAGESSGRPH